MCPKQAKLKHVRENQAEFGMLAIWELGLPAFGHDIVTSPLVNIFTLSQIIAKVQLAEKCFPCYFNTSDLRERVNALLLLPQYISPESYWNVWEKLYIAVFHLQINCMYCPFHWFASLQPVQLPSYHSHEENTALSKIACRQEPGLTLPHTQNISDLMTKANKTKRGETFTNVILVTYTFILEQLPFFVYFGLLLQN